MRVYIYETSNIDYYYRYLVIVKKGKYYYEITKYSDNLVDVLHISKLRRTYFHNKLKLVTKCKNRYKSIKDFRVFSFKLIYRGSLANVSSAPAEHFI